MSILQKLPYNIYSRLVGYSNEKQLYFIPVFIYTFIKVKSKWGKKRDGCATSNGLSHFSLLAAKFICAPGVIKAEQNDTLTKDKTPRLEPENIRESILDFTDHFGEINPDILYLCRRGLSELKKAVFAFFPSVRRESMKKNVKSSIFRKKNK